MSVNQPLVSVIIPTRNRKMLVSEAVESVLAQTWKQVEVIVVDDGSSDGTAEHLRAYPNLRLLRQPAAGQAQARNAGFRLARGSFISTLDSDDLWHPTFLELSMHAMLSLNAHIVFSNWIGRDPHGVEFESYFQKCYDWQSFQLSGIAGWRLIRPLEARAMYVDSCMSPSSALLIRRDCFPQGWLETLSIGDDWCLLLETVVSQPCLIGFTMEPLWIKRVQGDNIYDHNFGPEVRQLLHVDDIRTIRNYLRSKLTLKEYARMSAHVGYHQLALAKTYAKAGQNRRALSQAFWGLRALLEGLSRSPGEVWARLQVIVPALRRGPLQFPCRLAGCEADAEV